MLSNGRQVQLLVPRVLSQLLQHSCAVPCLLHPHSSSSSSCASSRFQKQQCAAASTPPQQLDTRGFTVTDRTSSSSSSLALPWLLQQRRGLQYQAPAAVEHEGASSNVHGDAASRSADDNSNSSGMHSACNMGSIGTTSNHGSPSTDHGSSCGDRGGTISSADSSVSSTADEAAKDITRAIRACSTAEQLVQVIAQQVDSMNAINLSAALNKLSKLQCEQQQPYAACMQRYAQHAADDSLRNLSNVVYALCCAPEDVRQQHQQAVQELLLPAFMQQLPAANPQDVNNVMYGLAHSGQQIEECVLQQLLNRFVEVLPQATPQCIFNALWALALTGQQVPEGQLQQLLDALVGMLHPARLHDTFNTLWAVSSMGQLVLVRQLEELQCASRQVMACQVNAQGLSNSMWAVATMGQQVPAQQLQKLLTAFADMLGQATPQDVSIMLWAVATMGQQVPALQLQQALDALVSTQQQAEPRDMAITLWAVASMGQQVPAQQLQQLLAAVANMLRQATPQNISNTLWAVATMGQRLPAQQLQQLLAAFAGMLQQAKPQSISNTLWAIASMRQRLPAQQLQQLLAAFAGMLQQAKPQSISNTLWAVASMGQRLPAQQLQQLLAAFAGMLQQAKPQSISNTLWAVASMGQRLPAQQLQQLLTSLVDMWEQLDAQAVSNTLWACAKMSQLPQELLKAPGLAAWLQGSQPQNVANAAWACAQLGHNDEQLMQSLLADACKQLAAARHSSKCITSSQLLCNMCWAVAILNLQQHAEQVLQLAEACCLLWSSTATQDQQQLWQVHTWLLDFQLAGVQGLQGVLTEQQLRQCKAAWDEAMQATQKQPAGPLQRAVFAAVQQLPIIWQQQPKMEQLSMGRDGVTVDGALLIDIAGRTADGVLVAVEADGPTHFRQPNRALTGPTQYRNRALTLRGYKLVSVPYFAWNKLRGAAQQQKYLGRRFREAGVL